MKDENNREWEAYVMGLVDANHSRAVTAARQAAAHRSLTAPRLSKRVLNVLGGVLWTAVLALAFVACLIYAAN